MTEITEEIQATKKDISKQNFHLGHDPAEHFLNDSDSKFLNFYLNKINY